MRSVQVMSGIGLMLVSDKGLAAAIVLFVIYAFVTR